MAVAAIVIAHAAHCVYAMPAALRLLLSRFSDSLFSLSLFIFLSVDVFVFLLSTYPIKLESKLDFQREWS